VIDLPHESLNPPPQIGRVTKPTSRIRRFSRDVLVNLTANPLTIAVVYLWGVVAGVIPRSPYLIVSSMAAILIAIAAVVGILMTFVMSFSEKTRTRKALTVFYLSFGLGGLGAIMAALLGFLGDPVIQQKDRIPYLIMGVGSVFLSAQFIFLDAGAKKPHAS